LASVKLASSAQVGTIGGSVYLNKRKKFKNKINRNKGKKNKKIIACFDSKLN
jgi:hypothetical protein